MKVNKWALWPSSWGAINVLFPFHERFQEAAEAHDLAYSLWWNENDRKLANYVFFVDCLDESKNNILAILFSVVYFILVSLFGNLFFNYETI